MRHARVVILWFNALLFVSCTEDEKKTRATENQPAPTTTIEDHSVLPTGSGLTGPSSAGAVGTAAPSSSATESATAVGMWEGSYDAKKGSVEMPGKVKDKARTKDDGKVAVGAGSVSVTIAADGELSGKATGALGDATLRGKVEGSMVRASVFPNHPSDPNAMTGVLVGMLKDGVIRAEIRVAGPDATIVRESPIELRRK